MTGTGPTHRPSGGVVPGSGYDQVGIPQPDGSVKRVTKAEFEKLPLADRIRLLMGEAKFYRAGQPISSREALRKS